jgi:outer membrane receptor protein involved in Fe transport
MDNRCFTRAVPLAVFALTVLAAGSATAATNVPASIAHPLPDRVVTVTKTDLAARDLPASADVLGADDLALQNPASVDEALKTVVGADVQGAGFPGSAVRLNFRGLTPGYQSERLLVLLDGRRLNDQYQGNVEFALLPADDLQRIEVLRGPASALYGSGAMGGVVQLFTPTGDEAPGTRLKAQAGSYGIRHYRLAHGGSTGSFTYRFRGSHVETDGYLDNRDGTDRDWRADNLAATLGYAFDGGPKARLDLGEFFGAGTDENSDRESRKNYQALTLSQSWACAAGPTDLSVLLYRNAERHDYDWKYPGKGLYEQETWCGDARASFWAGTRQRLTLGGEWRQDGVDVDEVQQAVDEATDTAALYLQDEIALAKSWRVTVGLRGDYNDDYADELSPRVGLLWRPAPWGEAFLSFNRAHRAPSLSDRFVRVEFNGMLFEGNPDLNPETLTAWELGARARLGRRLGAQVAVFDNRVEDSFDFMLDPDGVFRNHNVNEVRSYGAEVGLEGEWLPWLSAYANYSWTDGRYEEYPGMPGVEGNRLAYLARDKANAGLVFRWPAGASHALNVRYVGQRFGDAQNAAANRMSDYVVVDWRSRVPVGRGVTLTLNVDNALDESYRDWPAYEQPGTVFLAGAEVSF